MRPPVLSWPALCSFPLFSCLSCRPSPHECWLCSVSSHIIGAQHICQILNGTGKPGSGSCSAPTCVTTGQSPDPSEHGFFICVLDQAVWPSSVEVLGVTTRNIYCVSTVHGCWVLGTRFTCGMREGQTAKTALLATSTARRKHGCPREALVRVGPLSSSTAAFVTPTCLSLLTLKESGI